MIQAVEAKVEWNAVKNHWQVVLQAGSEVVRRQCTDTPREASEDQLRQLAMQTAKDEGYELDATHISIAH